MSKILSDWREQMHNVDVMLKHALGSFLFIQNLRLEMKQ
jgi:hypothetical protein